MSETVGPFQECARKSGLTLWLAISRPSTVGNIFRLTLWQTKDKRQSDFVSYAQDFYSIRPY